MLLPQAHCMLGYIPIHCWRHHVRYMKVTTVKEKRKLHCSVTLFNMKVQKWIKILLKMTHTHVHTNDEHSLAFTFIYCSCPYLVPCSTLLISHVQVRNEQQDPDQCDILAMVLHSNYSPSMKWQSSLCGAINWSCLNTFPDSSGRQCCCPSLKGNGCEGKKKQCWDVKRQMLRLCLFLVPQEEIWGFVWNNALVCMFVGMTACGSHDTYGYHYDA